MNAEPELLWGQCRCGAVLTYNHIVYHCPLRPQQEPVLGEASLAAIVRAIVANRLDTAHVAELGYN